MIKKFEHKNQTGTLFNRHHEKSPEIPGLLFWANGTELPFGGSFFLWGKAMKIIKAAAVYAAEQCLRTPRGEVYSFMATAGKVRITAKVEPEAKNEYLAVYCLGCGSQPRRLVLARQKDGTMTEVPHPAEKGVDYRYFLFGEDFAYAHYLRDDWYYREYCDWTVMSKNRQGVYEDISRQLAGAYKIAHVGRVGDCPGVLSVVVENGEEERRLLFEKRKGQYLATTAEVLEIRQNGRKFSRPVCWKPAAKLDVRDETYVLAEAKRMSGR